MMNSDLKEKESRIDTKTGDGNLSEDATAGKENNLNFKIDHAEDSEEKDTTVGIRNEAEEEEASKVIQARVLKIHDIPKYIADWESIKLPVSMLNRNKYSQSIDFQAESKILVVAFLGRGGNGEVWFAITPDLKRCCAVKFFFSPQGSITTKAQLAQNELENWNQVYGNDPNGLPKCHVGNLCDTSNHPYLCMPYISPAPKRMWPLLVDSSFFGSDDVEKALNKFARAGLKQGSLRLEHLGFFPKKKVEDDDEDDESLELYIVDLGRLTKFEPNEDKEAWVKTSAKALQMALPPLSVCNGMPLGVEGSFYEHLHHQKNNTATAEVKLPSLRF